MKKAGQRAEKRAKSNPKRVQTAPNGKKIQVTEIAVTSPKNFF